MENCKKTVISKNSAAARPLRPPEEISKNIKNLIENCKKTVISKKFSAAARPAGPPEVPRIQRKFLFV